VASENCYKRRRAGVKRTTPLLSESRGGWRKDETGSLARVSASCFIQCFDTGGGVTARTSTNPQRFSSGTGGEKNSRRNRLTQVHQEKWTLNGSSRLVVVVLLLWQTSICASMSCVLPPFLDHLPTSRLLMQQNVPVHKVYAVLMYSYEIS